MEMPDETPRCSSCDAKLASEDEFCKQCGAKGRPRRREIGDDNSQSSDAGQFCSNTRRFLSRQRELVSSKPFLTVYVWVSSLIQFFTFVSFMASWLIVDGNAFARGGDLGCSDSGTSSAYLFRVETCCDLQFQSKGCLSVNLAVLKNDDFKLKDAGAAAFFFIFVSFLLTPVLINVAYKKQTDSTNTLIGAVQCLDSRVPMMILTLTNCLLFMMAFSIYVGVVNDNEPDGFNEDMHFGFGVAASIIGFIVFLAFTAGVWFRWDIEGFGDQGSGEVKANPMNNAMPPPYGETGNGHNEEKAARESNADSFVGAEEEA
eukprot:gb/GECG01001168.1/.p1 GENE.gb/GECG01001168.1/~~gb/GECG01001168.1/.p1  ORF type:complete len:316 (+),score=31.98 gb/GECG01001168.1/:1-948(+)